MCQQHAQYGVLQLLAWLTHDDCHKGKSSYKSLLLLVGTWFRKWIVESEVDKLNGFNSLGHNRRMSLG